MIKRMFFFIFPIHIAMSAKRVITPLGAASTTVNAIVTRSAIFFLSTPHRKLKSAGN